MLWTVLVLAAGAIAACSDSSAPAELEGTYYLRLTDGRLGPVPYDPHAPTEVIWNVTVDIVQPDTIWLTTAVVTVDQSGNVVGTTIPLPVYYRYTRSGDSLYNVEAPGPLGEPPGPLGSIAGGVLHLRIHYPAPPVYGLPYLSHDYILTK